MSSHDPLAAVSDDGPLIVKKPISSDYEFDITAMIDLVFMMNIFFLVTSIASSLGELDLPLAQHPKAADVDSSILISILSAGEGKPAAVFLGEGSDAVRMPEGKEQEKQVQEAVEAAMKAHPPKNVLLIKAERSVLHRDVARVANVASLVEGLQLNLAVMEFDE